MNVYIIICLNYVFNISPKLVLAVRICLSKITTLMKIVWADVTRHECVVLLV